MYVTYTMCSYLCMSCRLLIQINFVFLVYLNFSQLEYCVYEDHDGPFCIELTYDKPAPVNTIITIITFDLPNLRSKLCICM